jgi:hypothetical protein
MELQKLIKHHSHEIDYWRRLHAHVAAEFHTEAAQVLEDIERRFDDAIIEGATWPCASPATSSFSVPALIGRCFKTTLIPELIL